MASSSKRARVNLVSAEIMLEKIFNDENSADGMDSGEESDLDRCPSGFGPPSADLDPPTKLSENIILNVLVKMDDNLRSSAY